MADQKRLKRKRQAELFWKGFKKATAIFWVFLKFLLKVAFFIVMLAIAVFMAGSLLVAGPIATLLLLGGILGLALALVPGRFLETSQSAWVKLIATFFTGIFIIGGLGLFLYGTAIVIDALAVLNTSFVATLGLTVGAAALPLWGVIALGAVASVAVVAIIVGIVTGVKNYRASKLEELYGGTRSDVSQKILDRSSASETPSYNIFDNKSVVGTDLKFSSADSEDEEYSVEESFGEKDPLDTASNPDPDPVNKKKLSEEEQYLYTGDENENENEEDDKSDTTLKPT